MNLGAGGDTIQSIAHTRPERPKGRGPSLAFAQLTSPEYVPGVMGSPHETWPLSLRNSQSPEAQSVQVSDPGAQWGLGMAAPGEERGGSHSTGWPRTVQEGESSVRMPSR